MRKSLIPRGPFFGVCLGGLLACLLPRLAAAHGTAGDLTATPNAACADASVRVTGTGWFTIFEECEYRFFFDTTQVAQQGPDVGLTEQPDRTFMLPATATPGMHTLKVELRRTHDQTVHAQNSIPFEVIEVKYDGRSDCNKLDSGFDDTTATSNPPWLSVAVGKTTKVASAIIDPAASATKVEFKSTDPSKTSVLPAKAEKSPQKLEVTGIGVGEPSIEAKVEDDLATVCKELHVAVYNKRRVSVAAHIVQLKGCSEPTVDISAGALRRGLNRIWDQAVIGFSVTLNKFFGKKAIDADADGDCVADEEAGVSPCQAVVFGPELQAIHAAAKNPNADLNVYFVERYQCPVAAAHIGARAIFLQQEHVATHEQVIAHEIGHFLIGPRHRDGPEDEPLMAPFDSANLCFLNKPEWDTSNTTAAGF